MKKTDKLVKVSDLFDVRYGINLTLVNLAQCKKTTPASIPFVSRTEKNNGISAYVLNQPDIEPNPPHTLSVAGGGSVLSTFFQPIPYYSGRDLYILIPREKIGITQMLFYAKCIQANKYKYSYGRQANRTLKDLLIPAEMPRELKKKLSAYHKAAFKRISPKPLNENSLQLSIHKWKSFKLPDLFDIKGSSTTPLAKLEEYGGGLYPYVTTRAKNNGAEGFYDFYTEPGNVLTIDSAVRGYCTYQKYSFSASDHVEKMIPKFNMNTYIALFLATVLNQECYRYNYGRKCSQDRLRNAHIKLPVNKSGNPDWQFMETYIKSLAYSSNLHI